VFRPDWTGLFVRTRPSNDNDNVKAMIMMNPNRFERLSLQTSIYIDVQALDWQAIQTKKV